MTHLSWPSRTTDMKVFRRSVGIAVRCNYDMKFALEDNALSFVISCLPRCIAPFNRFSYGK